MRGLIMAALIAILAQPLGATTIRMMSAGNSGSLVTVISLPPAEGSKAWNSASSEVPSLPKSSIDFARIVIPHGLALREIAEGWCLNGPFATATTSSMGANQDSHFAVTKKDAMNCANQEQSVHSRTYTTCTFAAEAVASFARNGSISRLRGPLYFCNASCAFAAASRASAISTCAFARSVCRLTVSLFRVATRSELALDSDSNDFWATSATRYKMYAEAAVSKSAKTPITAPQISARTPQLSQTSIGYPHSNDWSLALFVSAIIAITLASITFCYVSKYFAAEGEFDLLQCYPFQFHCRNGFAP